jgi:hypothetical protein
MEKDWKSTIGEYFKNNNVYRLNYLNDQLLSFCMEYRDYLEEFEGVAGKVLKERYNGEQYQSHAGNKYGILVTFDLRVISPSLPEFKLSCFFNEDGHLIIETTVDGCLLKTKSDSDYYEYEEEEFSEPEIIEKTYIFGLFNSRLMRFIETVREKGPIRIME